MSNEIKNIVINGANETYGKLESTCHNIAMFGCANVELNKVSSIGK